MRGESAPREPRPPLAAPSPSRFTAGPSLGAVSMSNDPSPPRPPLCQLSHETLRSHVTHPLLCSSRHQRLRTRDEPSSQRHDGRDDNAHCGRRRFGLRRRVAYDAPVPLLILILLLLVLVFVLVKQTGVRPFHCRMLKAPTMVRAQRGCRHIKVGDIIQDPRSRAWHYAYQHAPSVEAPCSLDLKGSKPSKPYASCASPASESGAPGSPS